MKGHTKESLFIRLLIWSCIIVPISLLGSYYAGLKLHKMGVTSSMQPTLVKNDYFLSTRNFSADNLKRGDIVLIRPDFNNTGYILTKRIIGLPGQHIRYRYGQLTVNGVRVEESYCLKLDFIARKKEPEPLMDEWEVRPGHFFVMGDYRSGSIDSRHESFGQVPDSMIMERVVWIF